MTIWQWAVCGAIFPTVVGMMQVCCIVLSGREAKTETPFVTVGKAVAYGSMAAALGYLWNL